MTNFINLFRNFITEYKGIITIVFALVLITCIIGLKKSGALQKLKDEGKGAIREIMPMLLGIGAGIVALIICNL